jgi:hypothetical protein
MYFKLAENLLYGISNNRISRKVFQHNVPSTNCPVIDYLSRLSKILEGTGIENAFITEIRYHCRDKIICY